MKKDALTLTTLAVRLERAIHADVGMQGLKTLLYGWKMKYHLIEDHTFHCRKQEDGEHREYGCDGNPCIKVKQKKR